MHTIPAFKKTVKLIAKNGLIRTYDSLEDLGAALYQGYGHWYHGELLKSLLTDRLTDDSTMKGGFYAVTCNGEEVSAASVWQAWANARLASLEDKAKSKPNWRYKPKGKFRDGPWPGLHHGKSNYSCRLRFPRTSQEIRASYRVVEDDEDIHLSRHQLAHLHRFGRAKSLPTSWDDKNRHTERSWKRQRVCRWRFQLCKLKNNP